MKIQNHCGLSFEFLANGNIRQILAGSLRIGLNEVSPYAVPSTNIYLRKSGPVLRYHALFGPGSTCRYRFSDRQFTAEGSWEGLEYTLCLLLSPEDFSWHWKVHLKNPGSESIGCDVVYLQDVGLKSASSGFQNEYYVSQYIEHLVFVDDRYGKVVCCRQNMKEDGRNPWLLLACANGAASACTDGIQFYGPAFRDTAIPEGLTCPEAGGALAGESSVMALYETPFTLSPGGEHMTHFLACFQPDHPNASSPHDLTLLTDLIKEEIPLDRDFSEIKAESNLFHEAGLFDAHDLDEADLNRFFGPEKRYPEFQEGRLLSFFCNTHSHVVLKEKEIRTQRPHGYILQAQSRFIADESLVSTTCWAYGVFNSHLTQGNTNFNILLSVCANPFHTVRENGQRIFVETDGKYCLLGVPSAFEMGLNSCRWIYKNTDHCFEVRTWTSKRKPVVNLSFRVLMGGPVRLRLTQQFDPLNQWTASEGEGISEITLLPAQGSMITEGFPEARFRMQSNRPMNAGTIGNTRPLSVLDIPAGAYFHLQIIGETLENCAVEQVHEPELTWISDQEDALEQWKQLNMHLSLDSDQEDVRAIREILPWYGMNALTHYLSPHGLEQFGGAAWGTRDVAQGPFDLLMATGHYSEARWLLLQIFAHQNPDGGWPQWWMFDRYARIRAGEAHGDITYWVILALAAYLRVTGDVKILNEALPYYQQDPEKQTEKSPLSGHLDRLISRITGSFIPGTAFVPFGGGDWNDSLQPVSHELAEKMISSWTVEMNYQAFHQLSQAFNTYGLTEKAEELDRWAVRIREDFNRWLIRDGQVCGYGISEPDGSIRVLLHPHDSQTPIRYSLLPMNRGLISGIFTHEQAIHHQKLIEEHLKGPDGARLMDVPLPYKGGIQEIFQRAESSTYFGREIGLMYIHEHIRYAEALAVSGKADAFVKALRQAIPVDYQSIVPMGDLRQSNCYYSSSDVVFSSRYEAARQYAEVIQGKLPLAGGWRVYSSGPGIFITLIIRNLLGIRVFADSLVLDPVMPASFDGLTAHIRFQGYPLTLRYSIKHGCHTPKTIRINGTPVAFTPEVNPYRSGGVVIDKTLFNSYLQKSENGVEIEL